MGETKCGFDDQAGGMSGSDSLIFFGPTLMVSVGFDPDFKPVPGAIPKAAVTDMHALVDTGATTSCIDSGLAMQLGLPVVDRQTISGVHGPKEVNVHLAQIHVPSLNTTIYGRFAAVDLVAGGQQHHVLIGRTFLSDFTMVYEGATGTVTIRSA
jgi:hypothetical protein